MSEASKALGGKGVWAFVAVVVIAGAVWMGSRSDRAGEDAAGTLMPAQRAVTETVEPTDATEVAGQVGPSAEELAEPAPGDVDADRAKSNKAGEAVNTGNGVCAPIGTLPTGGGGCL